jgi:3-isopropylmalate/(R)-2-methylmalate dehydratase small subunit
VSLLPLRGRARILGNDVNTDYIITSRRKKETIDPSMLRRYLLEDVDAGFAASVRPGDILVAGRNFGCGSAMEVAVTAPRAAGVRAVVARSFARTFYRNAINNGLLPVLADTGAIEDGAVLEIVVAPEGTAVLLDGGARGIPAKGIPESLVAIFEAGGLVPYLAANRGFRLGGGAALTGPPRSG